MKIAKYGSLFIVLGSGVFLLIYSWLISLTEIKAKVGKLFYWNYDHHMFFFIIPIVMVVIHRSRIIDYAINIKNLGRMAFLGTIIIIPLLTIPFAAHLIEGPLHLSHVARDHALSTFIFQIFFVAIGEELFFRGFWQGEINRSFGRPFHLGKIKFGFGLILPSSLFGLSHMLNHFNPFIGSYHLHLLWGLSTFFFAFITGLLRERFNTLIIPAMLHVSYNIYIVWFERNGMGIISFNFAVSISYFLAFLVMFINREDEDFDATFPMPLT